MGTVFTGEILKANRKVLNDNNSHVLVLIIFYEHKKTNFFKVLGYVIYLFIKK